MPRAPKRTRARPLARSRREVALLIETSNSYARNLLHGVVGYIREHEPWSFHLVEQGRGGDPPAWLSRWRGDGIIARIENSRIADAVRRTRLPAVDLSAGRFVPSLPWVETDDVAIAALAVEHFRQRGFRHFGYCGDARFQWSRRRGEAFGRLLRQAGHEVSDFQPPAGDDEVAQRASLQRWLAGLPKPAGIFACYDIRGVQVLDACRHARLSVPEEVAVLGVDDDTLLCELAFPPLSSVVPNARRAGYEAAALLARLMRGERVPAVETRVEPIGIQLRQSTDVLAVSDPLVVRALSFIREHACDPIGVEDVLQAVPLSRRILEQRFQRLLNRSPHAEILAVRLARVKRLLAETDLSLEVIAARCGFAHPEYLSVAFKRETGTSPRAFRQGARR